MDHDHATITITRRSRSCDDHDRSANHPRLVATPCQTKAHRPRGANTINETHAIRFATILRSSRSARTRSQAGATIHVRRQPRRRIGGHSQAAVSRLRHSAASKLLIASSAPAQTTATYVAAATHECAAIGRLSVPPPEATRARVPARRVRAAARACVGSQPTALRRTLQREEMNSFSCSARGDGAQTSHEIGYAYFVTAPAAGSAAATAWLAAARVSDHRR